LTGCYIIEFDGIEGNEELIWRTYTTLTQVESAFCSMKTDLGTRPVYHQGAERTKAHLFISILAYHLLVNIEHRLLLAGKAQKWHKLRLSLQNHRRSTLQWKDELGSTYFKKISTLPEPIHMDIYSHLAVKNPLKDMLFSAKCSNEKIRFVD
jgi:transposase